MQLKDDVEDEFSRILAESVIRGNACYNVDIFLFVKINCAF